MPEDRLRPSAARAHGTPPKKNRMPLILGGVVVLAGAAYGVFTLMGKGKEEQRAAQEAGFAAAPVIEAEALAKAWRADAATFDKEHRAKALAVSGIVDRKESIEGAYGAGTKVKVFLKGLEGAEILCQMDPDHAADAAPLAAGARVTLVGTYAGDDGNGALILRSARKDQRSR